jgi:Uncharacterized conserved domain (SAYSvFN)
MPPRGFSKSRALWDNATGHSPWPQRLQFLLRALLYELQPVRFAVWRSNSSEGLWWCRQACGSFVVGCRTWIPYLIRGTVVIVSRLTWNQWKGIGCIVLYCLFIRWIHRALDAGPLVLIVTTLAMIFTVGLSDDAHRDGLSAYSVFNKGFQKLLGSVDAEALLQQHVGGGWMPLMMPAANHMDDAPPIQRRRAPRRNDPPPILEEEEEEADEARPQDAVAPVNRARRTGKKARRDRAALEQRREIRAQREAAMAMGFGHLDDDAVLAQLLQGNEANGH